MLFINILPLQQTSPTMFITTLIVVALFIIVLFIVSKNNENEETIEKKENTDLVIKMNQLTKEIKSPQDEIEEVCSFVEKHYDKSKNIISIKPKDYGFYPELGDPIEETEVMVIEYLQVLKEKERSYKYDWSYLGLIDDLCVYKIDKKLKYSKETKIKLKDINSALLKNDFITEKSFKDIKKNISIIPFLIPVDNLGFNRDLTESETNEVIKDFCIDSDFDFIKNKVERVEKNGTKYNKYFIAEKSELNKVKKKSRRISQPTKDKVWRRDEGKCVECGSNEKLEFDHIIPFSKGGSNTYRNIQLLCESCNRSKSDKIG